MKTRLLIPIAVATAAAALSATPAGAEPETAEPQRVSVTANPDGLVAPGVATLRPGTTTFTVSTPDTGRRYVGVVGLEPGASFDSYLDNMATVLFSEDDAAKQRAGNAVQRDVALGGGVALHARAAQSVTVLLAPGTYYLVDLTSLGQPNPVNHWHRITVSGHWTIANPGTDHVVLQYERDGRPRFAAPTRIAPRGTILVANTTAFLHEAVFVPVAPGTTDEDIDRHFAGQGPYPFVGEPQGMLPIVGGQAAVLHADLAPGRYALVSYVGFEIAAGMHQVIDVG